MAKKLLSKNDLIVFVEPQPSQFGKLSGDLSFDIYTNANLPARGINTLGAVAKSAGFLNIAYIDKYHGNINNQRNRRLLSRAALIGVSSITRTDSQAMELLDQYKDKITIAGGFGPTFRYSDYVKHADVVVIGEAEDTFPELLLTFAGEKGSLDEVDGIAYDKNGEVVVTKPRKPLSPERLSLIHPDYDKITLNSVRTFSVEDSRGCPKNCKFCTVTKAYGRIFRNKTDKWIVDELARTQGHGTSVFFTGDNFIGNPERAKGILKSIIKSGLNKRYGVIEATIQLADYPEIMNLLWKAGVRSVCLGIESINDDILKELNKGYDAKKVKESVKKIRDYGFLVHGMFIIGADNDNPEKARQLGEWASRNVDSAQFFALIPLPGTDIEKQFRQEGRLIYPKGNEHFHLYDGDHVLFKPKNFKSAYHLQKTVYKIYENFYSWKNGIKRVLKSRQKKVALALLVYTRFKGKKVLHSPQSREHLRNLHKISL